MPLPLTVQHQKVSDISATSSPRHPFPTHLCSDLSSGLASSLNDLYSTQLEEDPTYLASFPPDSSSSSPLAPPASSRPRPQEYHSAFRASSGRYLSRSIPVSSSSDAAAAKPRPPTGHLPL